MNLSNERISISVTSWCNRETIDDINIKDNNNNNNNNNDESNNDDDGDNNDNNVDGSIFSFDYWRQDTPSSSEDRLQLCPDIQLRLILLT